MAELRFDPASVTADRRLFSALPVEVGVTGGVIASETFNWSSYPRPRVAGRAGELLTLVVASVRGARLDGGRPMLSVLSITEVYDQFLVLGRDIE